MTKLIAQPNKPTPRLEPCCSTCAAHITHPCEKCGQQWARSIKDIELQFFKIEDVKVIVNPKMQGLCTKPYPGHPKGCPNYGKKLGCPPRRLWSEVRGDTATLVAARFDFAAYRAMMAGKHPTWTDRQLRNPLYWQGYMRKRFKDFISYTLPGQIIGGSRVPEALGVNVTETCKGAGIYLEWPPDRYVWMVALYEVEK